jgi:type VI protein secretion system component VasK
MATENQKFWSRWIVTGVIFAMVSTISGFMFTKVTAMPETYATQSVVKEVKQDAAEDRDRIREAVKDGFDRVIIEQRRINDSIKDLNEYLRDHQ